MVGNLKGTISFGLGNLTAAGVQDVFVVVYNPSGTAALNQTRFGAAGVTVSVAGVTVDADGNIVIAGNYSGGGVAIGGATLATTGTAYVAGLTPQLAHRWSRAFTLGAITINGVVGGGGPNTYLTGVFTGAADFGTGSHGAGSDGGGYLTALNSQGTTQWSKALATNGPNLGKAALTATGDVLWAIGFQGYPMVGGMQVQGGSDTRILVTRLTSAGVFSLVTTLDTNSGATVKSLAARGGSILVGGEYRGRLLHGGQTYQAPTDGNSFIASLAASGAHEWAKVGELGRSGVFFGLNVEHLLVDDANNLLIVGGGGYSFAFDGLSFGCLLTDAFLGIFNSDQEFTWGNCYFGDSHEVVAGAALYNGRDVLLVGNTYQGDVDFGSGPIGGSGDVDVIIVRLGR